MTIKRTLSYISPTRSTRTILDDLYTYRTKAKLEAAYIELQEYKYHQSQVGIASSPLPNVIRKPADPANPKFVF